MIGQWGLLKWKHTAELDPLEKYYKIMLEHNQEIRKDIKQYEDWYYTIHPEEKPLPPV